MKNSYALNAAAILLAASLFGLQPIYGLMLKGASVDVNGLMLIRFSVPAMALLSVLLWLRPKFNLRDGLKHARMGIAFAVTGIGYYQAGYQIGFSLAVILFYTFPVMVAVYSATGLGHRLSPVQWGAITVASVGLVLAIDVQEAQFSWIGIGWALASAGATHSFWSTNLTMHRLWMNGHQRLC